MLKAKGVLGDADRLTPKPPSPPSFCLGILILITPALKGHAFLKRSSGWRAV